MINSFFSNKPRNDGSFDVDNFDFGFSTFSEEELAQKEREAEARARQEVEKLLRQQQSEATSVINELTGTAEDYKKRLLLLHSMVLPLLNNLIADSDTKSYIYWPDRKKKIQDFIQRINTVIND